MLDNGEYWYRYEEQRFAPPLDEFGECVGLGSLRMMERRYRVIKHTPKGVWLNINGGKRFVLKEGKKLFACDTKEKALWQTYHRKKRHISILQAQVKSATQALVMVEDKLGLRALPDGCTVLQRMPDCLRDKPVI